MGYNFPFTEGFDVEAGEDEALALEEIHLEERVKNICCPNCDECLLVVKYSEGDARENEKPNYSYFECMRCGYQEEP